MKKSVELRKASLRIIGEGAILNLPAALSFYRDRFRDNPGASLIFRVNISRKRLTYKQCIVYNVNVG